MTDAEGYRAAVFDLGQVIIGINLTRTVAIWAEATGLSPGQIAARFRFDDVLDGYECGRVSTEQYHRHLACSLGTDMPFEVFERGWNGLFDGTVDGMDRLLETLGRRLRLVVLSNTNDLHARKWRALYARQLRHFERVFCSHEMGVRKPDPRSYRLVLDYLALPARQVLFIDDRPANVAGAEAVGMRGILAASARDVAAGLTSAGIDLVLQPE